MQTKPDLFGGDAPARVKIGVTDLDGVLRAKYLSGKKFAAAHEGGFGFCNVIFGWDSQDALYDKQLNDPGFADARGRIDENTGRKLPWENDLPFFLADFRDDPGVAGTACPRSLLLRILARANEMGFTPRFGPEYEWFAYRETPASLAEKDYHSPTPLSPGMFGYSGLRTGQRGDLMRDLFDGLAAFDVDLEGLHTETGPGVLEAAITYCDALEAADRAALFKQGVKEISYRHGLVSSFMAKPSADLPGCGGHLHQSLWRDEENVFHDPDGRFGMSKIFESYLAGQLRLLPVLMPLFAPTVNSYKRYVAGSWAATRANWGVDNRTVALRVIPGSPESTRLETRVPGADANPYLAIAGALAAGLHGIAAGWTLDEPPVEGSAYEQAIGTLLPRHLGAAAGAMAGSGEAAELLGSGFRDHFVKTREWEWEQYLGAVTDWERRRYFELT